MTRLEKALRALAGELDRREIDWALVGGMAVGSRAEPRTTRDIDVVVIVEDDEEVESLVADLRGSGYRILSALEHQDLERLATVRMTGPQGAQGVVVDLLFASSGIESSIAREAERLEIVPGLVVPVARTGHLILELLARDDRSRPQDAADLRALVDRADPEEIARARASARAIQDAGADRGRDLAAALEEVLRSA